MADCNESNALSKNHTRDSATLTSRKSMVGCKWIYRIKTHSDGCLVVKSFSQEYGIDYEETFAPVALILFVHALLVVAATSKWDSFQMDVKNDFLNGNLSEEVYMQSPTGLSIELSLTFTLWP